MMSSPSPMEEDKDTSQQMAAKYCKAIDNMKTGWCEYEPEVSYIFMKSLGTLKRKRLQSENPACIIDQCDALGGLPNETWTHIISFMSDETSFAVRFVCHGFRNMIKPAKLPSLYRMSLYYAAKGYSNLLGWINTEVIDKRFFIDDILSHLLYKQLVTALLYGNAECLDVIDSTNFSKNITDHKMQDSCNEKQTLLQLPELYVYAIYSGKASVVKWLFEKGLKWSNAYDERVWTILKNMWPHDFNAHNMEAFNPEKYALKYACFGGFLEKQLTGNYLGVFRYEKPEEECVLFVLKKICGLSFEALEFIARSGNIVLFKWAIGQLMGIDLVTRDRIEKNALALTENVVGAYGWPKPYDGEDEVVLKMLKILETPYKLFKPGYLSVIYAVRRKLKMTIVYCMDRIAKNGDGHVLESCLRDFIFYLNDDDLIYVLNNISHTREFPETILRVLCDANRHKVIEWFLGNDFFERRKKYAIFSRVLYIAIKRGNIETAKLLYKDFRFDRTGSITRAVKRSKNWATIKFAKDIGYEIDYNSLLRWAGRSKVEKLATEMQKERLVRHQVGIAGNEEAGEWKQKIVEENKRVDREILRWVFSEAPEAFEKRDEESRRRSTHSSLLIKYELFDEYVTFMESRMHIPDREAIKKLVKKAPHLVPWAVKRGAILSNIMFGKIIDLKKPEIVKELVENCGVKWFHAAYKHLVATGDLELLIWAEAHGCIPMCGVNENESDANLPPHVRHEIKLNKMCELRIKETGEIACSDTQLIIYHAMASKNIGVFNHVLSNPYLDVSSVFSSEHAKMIVLENAISYNMIEVVQKIIDIGCGRTARMCTIAAASGFLEVLKCLKLNGFPWDITVCKNAVEYKHPKLFRWARKYGAPIDEETVQKAFKRGYV